ncbi:MAG: 3-hydroxybutyryl-CoA dehydrogenase [Kofleriaceae bacterium]|nr:MAG: 3-hydroxybutyryl-CoA dehydrogenase [Kofleriaceae bacterium]MBZ0232197.1 3-hydroxybutyryl-CoA dehydrogenase [Kofleriaceae bacterium]
MSEIKTVGVVGAGLMGTGIAEVCALAGLRTILIRATGGDPDAAVARVKKSIDGRVAKGKLDAAVAEAALAKLSATTDLARAAECDLVIESIVEDLATKRALFASLAPHLRPDAILASNTSTLKISDLAEGPHDQRTIGLHFFSPVPAMSLVEVAHLPTTDADALAAAEAFVGKLGKTAVPVLDSTGFIVNRLLVPMLTGAIAAYEQGLAPAEHVDTAMRLGCGHPLGPLALADLIGLDVVYAMAKLLYKEFGDDRFRPPALLRRLVQNGHLGKKTGLGLYDYSAKPPRANTAALVVDDAAAAAAA